MTDPIHQRDPRDIHTLLELMRRLRAPDGGCPWDVEQTFRTIAPYTVEEAYEVADAIERGDMNDLREELGDLLFQTVFHAQMGAEDGVFDFGDVVEAITTKMIRRHPHVFDAPDGRDADDQTLAWEEMKARERAAKGHTSVLDDVPAGLPGLTRAAKLHKRAARLGFDWPNAKAVFAKINEELGELLEAIDEGDTDHIEEEYGDVLSTLATLAMHLKIEPEAALRRTNEKFITRFHHVERRTEQWRAEHAGMNPGTNPDLDLMESWWTEAKRH